MENEMVLDSRAKTRLGVICAIPLFAFLVVFIAFSVMLWPLMGGHPLYAIEGIISRNYDTLFTLMAADAIVTTPVFIYCLVLLARMKNITSFEKLIWVVALSLSAPVASVLFWYFHIRSSKPRVPIYPDIA